MTKFEAALDELRDAYEHAASLCGDPPDDDFEDVYGALEEAGGYGIGLEEEPEDDVKPLKDSE